MATQPEKETAQPDEPVSADTSTAEPETKTADDANKGVTLDNFNDDEKKFLESQGVKDFTNPEDLKKLVNQALTSKQSAAEKGNEAATLAEQVKKLQSLGETKDPTPTTEPVKETEPATEPAPAAPAPEQTNPGIDPQYATTLLLNHQQLYPELKEAINDSSIYVDYVKLTGDAGLKDYQKLSSFMESSHERAQLNAKIAELEKNNPGDSPNALPENIKRTGTMSQELAEAIITGGDTERRDEAIKFIQDNPKTV